MDVFSKAQRSEIMRHVRSRDTKPERLIRNVVSSMTFRIRTPVLRGRETLF
ncbi:MAG: hypothetical protein ACRD1O_13285 [Terriglobia bacterium]